LNAYECRRPNGLLRFRCRACRDDFTITSGTLFAFHKLTLRGYLADKLRSREIASANLPLTSLQKIAMAAEI
jgi:hypothetical protein